MANPTIDQPSTDHSDSLEPQISSLQDASTVGSAPLILNSSAIRSRSKSPSQGFRKLKRASKKISKRSHCGGSDLYLDQTAQSVQDLQHSHDDSDNQQDFMTHLVVSDTLPALSVEEIKQKRNRAFPHAYPIRVHRSLDSAQLCPCPDPPRFMAARPASLFVASLGNPPPYHSTRHSAGHIVLNHLRTNLSLPPFVSKSSAYAGGHVSIGADASRPELTLWQSPSLMNVSGVALVKAWNSFVNIQAGNYTDPITGLIVLHDDMEAEPGRIKLRRGGSGSAKGHNGIKSLQSSMQSSDKLRTIGPRLLRIGIGIGRPPGGSRDSRDVSSYVLGQLTPREKDGLEKAAREVEGVLYAELAKLGNS